jgi:hypothetical protein
MVEIATLDSSEAPRARRWDALILGSGLAALVAAARISSTGQRVLVVEEEARVTLPPSIKEPFFLSGFRDQGLLDASLRALTVPLIDRRRITTERLAYQVASDPVRLDIGQPVVTAEEFVTWGLAEPEEAQTLVRRMVEASEVERTLLYESSFVRLGRRSSGAPINPPGSGVDGARASSGRGIGHHKRGLPGEVSSASARLSQIFAAQIRALSNLGHQLPSPESQARLLGVGLAGGAGFSDDPPWLVDLFRKRVAALYGDMRTLSGDFDLVSVAGQPGIRVLRTGEIWLGRALVLGAPPSALRDAYGEDPMRPPPELLNRRVHRAFRGVFLYRVPTSILPEGMSARVILPGATPDQPTAAVTAYPCQTHPNRVDLVARAVLPEVAPADLDARLEELRSDIGHRLRHLMPFCGDQLDFVRFERPKWDSDDGWLEDPAAGIGWPSEVDLRLSSRPPVYLLDRSACAGLGLEGDLLLGWRGGDAIANELT